MDEIEEGQLSSDVQNSNKDELEDCIENKNKNELNITESPPNTDCVLCGNYACICDKNSTDDHVKPKQNETEEGEIVESDNCSIKLKENCAIKPLLNKKQAKKRLQAFSSEQKSVKRKKNLPIAKAPKVVVSIETQYDENGEVTEDKLVIRKVPKIGPNSQEKAKSVISEIEEIKRRSNMSVYNHEKLYPKSVVSTIFKKHENSSDGKHKKYSNHFEESRSRKRRSRSREHTRSRHESDRNSNRNERHRSDRHSNSSANPATTWPEYKASDRPNLSKRKLYDPIHFNMVMQVCGFDTDAPLFKGTFYTAQVVDTGRVKFFYRETIKRTKTIPNIIYSPNLKHAENLFPTRTEVCKLIPPERLDVIKEFWNKPPTTTSNRISKKQTSQHWYNSAFCVERDDEDLNKDEISEQSPLKEPNSHKEEDTSIVNKSYGLSVLSENYQNHWGDESESETGKKLSRRNRDDVLPEDISADENDLDYTPENVTKKDIIDNVIKANDGIDNNDDQSPEIKTPDTDEYRSNWEVEEDPLIDYKSPQIWDSDDNSTLSRKASKKFHNNLYTNKKKFDFSDIAYNDKSNLAISNGLSDSFMNSFGYRRSTSPSSPEKHRKYKERHSDDSRSSKSKYEHFTETKRLKHISKINLSSLEEDLEIKRRSIFKNKPYDDYDVKRSTSIRSNHVDNRSKHWENDEDVHHYQHRREKIWEDKKTNWKENDINEFRMQEKIKLNESLERNDEKIEGEESTKLEEIEKRANPPVDTPPSEPMIDETSNNNSKLVSEYEEFMKTVGFEAAVQDEIFSNETNIESRIKKSKKNKESSDDSSDEDDKPKNRKRRNKKKLVSSSSSSDSSSSSSSSDSSDSDTDSSDSSTSSSSSSSVSSKDDEILDPLKIKVEKVSDDDSKMMEKMNQIKNSVKVEQGVVQEISSEIVPIQDSSIPLPESDSVVNISNTTISLTLTPSKRQQFKPLLLDNESNGHVNKNMSSEDKDTEMDFTDIIMKRSREGGDEQPDTKKQKSGYENVSPTPSRERNESRRSGSRRRESPRERSRNHYRDEGHRGRRDRSRERSRRSGEYRHSRGRHSDINDRRSKYYDDKYYRNKSKPMRRSRSPLNKQYRRDDTEKYRNDREYSSNSPLDGFKRSLADSTISDSELISSQTLSSSIPPGATENDYKKTLLPKQSTSPSVDSPISPKRLSLDDRINQFLGIESEPPSSKAPTSTRRRKIDETSSSNGIYAQNSYDDYMTQDYYDRYANYVPPAQHHQQHYEGYHHPSAHHHNTSIPPPNFYPSVPPPTFNRMEMPLANIPTPRTNSGTQVVQVGNVLQVVPTELPTINRPQQYDNTVPGVVMPKKEVMQAPPISSETTKTKVVQVGNMIQIVPTAVLPDESVVSPPKPPIVQSELVKIETKKEENISVIPSPVQVVEKVIIVDETALKKKLEKEKRHSEREKRRLEREAKRREKQKRRDQRLKLKTEKMIKQALLMETSDSQVSDLDVSNILQDSITEDTENVTDISVNNNSLQSMWPPPAPIPILLLDPPTKGILMKSGFSKIKTDIEGQVMSELGVEEIIKVQKTVKFADGIKPGEGTSPSGGEELPSPPPPKRKLPKEQRYKKTKLKNKKKVKVKIIRSTPTPIEDEDSDDNLPPPPPPPGSPPPHLWPPKYMEPQPPISYGGGPMPPHLPSYPHPGFPPNGAHLPPPPPGFIPPPNNGPPLMPPNSGPPLIPPNGGPPLIPKNHLNSQPPSVFPPNIFPPLGHDGPPPPPPPYLEGRPPPPGSMNMPPGNMFVPKYSKMM